MRLFYTYNQNKPNCLNCYYLDDILANLLPQLARVGTAIKTPKKSFTITFSCTTSLLYKAVEQCAASPLAALFIIYHAFDNNHILASIAATTPHVLCSPPTTIPPVLQPNYRPFFFSIATPSTFTADTPSPRCTAVPYILCLGRNPFRSTSHTTAHQLKTFLFHFHKTIDRLFLCCQAHFRYGFITLKHLSHFLQ